MVVIKEFHPCQRNYVFQYAEQKRIEKKLQEKVAKIENFVQIESSESFHNPLPSLISSTIDFEKFLQETEQHLIEAKEFGYQITSIHNAVQGLNNLKSSELLQRLKAGNSVEEKESSNQKIERYANGTLVNDEIYDRRHVASPTSIVSLEDYKLHGRMKTSDLHNYQMLRRRYKNGDEPSCLSSSSTSENSSNDSLSKNIEKHSKFPVIIDLTPPQSNRKPIKIPTCPPRIKKMLEEVKQRKCVSKRVAHPVSILNLKLV